MSALILDEQRQTALFDGESLEDVDKFVYLDSILFTNGRGTVEVRNRINLVRFAFSHLQSCLWSRSEISLRTKGRVFQIVAR